MTTLPWSFALVITSSKKQLNIPWLEAADNLIGINIHFEIIFEDEVGKQALGLAPGEVPRTWKWPWNWIKRFSLLKSCADEADLSLFLIFMVRYVTDLLALALY